MYICRALLKHGYSSFGLSILEYCSVENLIQREQYYIDTLVPEYNICKTAGSTLGKTHSEKTRAKLSESAKGKNHSEKTLCKISVSIRAARLGTKHKDETRLKIGVTLGIVVEVTDLEVGETVEYFSMREAARKLNTNVATIRNYINYKKPFQGRFLIVKKDNNVNNNQVYSD
jgi:group I intron endonuclease